MVYFKKIDGKKSTRLQSLDTFRGLAIAVMIFVNFGAGKREGAY